MLNDVDHIICPENSPVIFLSYSVLYIQPDANSKNALQELSDVISSSMTKQPDGIFRVDS